MYSIHILGDFYIGLINAFDVFYIDIVTFLSPRISTTYGNTLKYENIQSGSVPFSTWTDTIVAAATFARAQL